MKVVNSKKRPKFKNGDLVYCSYTNEYGHVNCTDWPIGDYRVEVENGFNDYEYYNRNGRHSDGYKPTLEVISVQDYGDGMFAMYTERELKTIEEYFKNHYKKGVT